MKYKVIRRFRDCLKGKVYNIGDELTVTDEERGQYLVNLGLLQKKRGRKSERSTKKKH
jgi:hypothetical protein